MYSPWAKDLCAELHSLLEGDEKAKTRRILKKRVLVAGKKLLEIVGSRVDDMSRWQLESGRTGDGEEMMRECVYYEGHVVRIVRNG